jgi:hypothetical protein
MIRRYESTNVAVVDLALGSPDGHGFGFAKQQTPFASLCHHVERHEQQDSNKSEPKPYISSLKSRKERCVIVENSETIDQITICHQDEQHVENTEIWSILFHFGRKDNKNYANKQIK